MAAPHREREAPTRATQRTRGRRTKTMTDWDIPSGAGRPNMVFQMAVSVSLTGMATLPAHTQSSIAARVIARKIIYSYSLK